MSDDEDHSSLEDDFSASEDEWKPGKGNRQASEDESDDDDSDFEDDAPGSKKRDSKSRLNATSKPDGGAKQTKKRKSTGTSLRTKLFNKYKPPPKTVRNQATPSKPSVEPVKSAKKPQKKGLQVDSSDSDSSGDDYLVNPEELDLQSSFFDVKPSTSGEAAPPQFDCNAGMKLTDSEGDGDDDDDETESIRVAQANSKNSTKPVDLGYLQDFASNMEKAKVQYKKHKDRSLLASSDAKVDVSSLLAMGEGATSSSTASNAKKTKNPKRQSKKQQASQVAAADTDSDWEEVEGRNEFEPITQHPDTLTNGIQVCVDLPQRQRKDKKAIDLEATLKRQLNRIIKENQIFLHKVSLLGHIYYGFFLNKLANNINLMPIVLKLLPSKNVYPTGQTEIKYFQSMVTWFKTAVKIVDDRMYPKLKVDPLISLAVQMKHRHAVCKRDFLLMFVILLRAMGMQCRLVVNMVPLPLKPPQSSLCSLKMKPAEESGKQEKPVKKETSAKKVKPPVKKEPIKSPLLSNESRIELKRKVETLEKEINDKKRGKLQPKPSFEEVLEAKAPPVKTLKKAAAKPNDTSSKKDDLKTKLQEEQKATSSKKEDLKMKSQGKPKDTNSKKEDLKRKSLEKPSESGKKKKPDAVPTKSPYFSDSEKSNSQKLEQDKLKASLESHSKSFDEQKPSISVSMKRSTAAKSVAKAAAPRNTLSQPKTTSKTAKQKVESNKVAPQIVITTENLENLTNSQSSTKSTGRQTKASKALQASANQATVTRNSSKSPNPSGSAKTATKPEKSSPRKLRSKVKLTVPQLDGADDMPKRRGKKTAKTIQTDSEDDFQPSPPKRPKAVEKLRQGKIDRQVLSPDVADEEQSPSKVKKNSVNLWVEVYCELEDKWVCVDLFKGKVNCIDTIRKSVTPSTLAYVFAYNNDATIKDITPRYCTQWTAVVRKGRVEQAWLDEAIREHVTTHRTQRDLTEDMDMRRIHLDKPMPTTISEYKDNPLYALERHLLKFQAIYPPNALTLGFVRGEPVYARECVHTLHSREIWLKSARVVKLGEKPYKIVKARPKWDKMTSTVIKDQPLEIFGCWQTQEYEPPTAENGIVPRNAYGNVELFKECMLPKKTVHLHLPGLNRVCKKLGIDCVPAVIGFDFHQGSCHPLYDGFVVCEEFAEIAADAWEKDQQEAERKEQEKYEARVYGNWKKLIKGLLIRERLKLKYNF